MKPLIQWKILSLLAMTVCLSACETLTPRQYSGEEMGAYVVEANTQKPLEGVIVVAYWKLERGTLGGNVDVGTLQVMEAVTDKNGQFSFPAWGPKTVWRGRLSGHSPTILFFKPGYEWKKLYPNWEGKPLPNPRTHWTGKAIALSKFTGSLEEYAEHYSSLSITIDSILDLSRGGRKCYWKKVPRTVVTLNNMSLGLKKRSIDLFGSHILEIGDISVNQDCGSPQAFLKDYIQ